MTPARRPVALRIERLLAVRDRRRKMPLQADSPRHMKSDRRLHTAQIGTCTSFPHLVETARVVPVFAQIGEIIVFRLLAQLPQRTSSQDNSNSPWGGYNDPGLTVGELDKRVKKNRSASAVAAAAAASSVASVRRTMGAIKAKETAAAKALRVRQIFQRAKPMLLGAHLPSGSCASEIVGDPPNVGNSVGMVASFFTLADSAENAAVVFEALSIALRTFGRSALVVPLNRAGIFEEIVQVLQRLSLGARTVTAVAFHLWIDFLNISYVLDLQNYEGFRTLFDWF